MGVSAPIEGQSLLYRALIARTEPAIGHMLVALPIVLAVAIAGFKRGVLQVPAAAVWVPLLALFLWLAVGVPVSPTRYEAILDFARWVAAFAALIGSCFLLGRGAGPRVAAWSLFAGVAVVGVVGIAEFAYLSQTVGNHRIFVGWHNPNAVAGILLIGLPLGMGLFAGAQERLERLLLGFGMAVILCALWFTGSKGGLAAAAVGVVSWFVLCGLKRGVPSGWWKGALAAGIGGALLIGLLGFGAARLGTSSIAGRLGEGGTAEQSAGFRTTLWKDSLKLATQMPVMGHGAGAYSLAIRREGTTLGSELAHQTYLQMATEYGFVGLGIALFLVGAWLFTALRKHPTEPADKTGLRYAVIAAVLAMGANGLVESNLSYFGIRMALFALLGIGLNLSVDGLVPERIPAMLRGTVAALLATGAGYTFVAAALTDQKVAQALESIQAGRPGEAQRALLSARKIAPADPQPTYQLAKLAGAMNDWKSVSDLTAQAAARNPDASTYGLMAQAEASLGRIDGAMAAIDMAILAEPNDPYWQTQKFDLLRAAGRYDQAEAAAKEAITVEEQLRARPNALPWTVSTDTINARRWLAMRAKSDEERTALLRGLFDLLATYAERTVPELSRVTGYIAIADAKKKLGEDATDEAIAKELNLTLAQFYTDRTAAENTPLVGETVALAREKLNLMNDVGEELERIYRSASKSSEADAVRTRLDSVEEAGFLR
jgi:O-antigen ligase/tetratricopeptide (TPR) repeat protein